jgi:hypothetical protein
METERKKQLALGALVVILLFVLYQVYSATPTTSTVPTASSNGRAAPTRTAQSGAPEPADSGVHLHTLTGDRPKPEASERNLFRFATKAPPPPPVQQLPPRITQPAIPVEPVASGPPQPAPPPPITLKFIGVIEATERAQKIAVLSDGRNLPFYGREGDIIEGRYRILKIGVESIELAYVDGRGRQTIRLTGG